MEPGLFLVWEFDKAPQELQDLSTFEGDEDWLVLTSRETWRSNLYIRWLDSIGVSEPMRYKHPTDPDLVVFIGAH